MHLAAGLQPDPLGSLKHSLRPRSWIKGRDKKGGKGRSGREGEWRGKRGEVKGVGSLNLHCEILRTTAVVCVEN